MGLLPWSFGFLLVFSLLLWSQLKTMTETLLEHQLVLNSVELFGNDIGEKIEENISNSKGGGSSGNNKSNDPKGKKHLSSKLNVRQLFDADNGKKDDVKKIFFRLVSILYGSQPIFVEGNNTARVVDLFEKVLEKHEEMKNKGYTFHKCTDLSRIDLRDDPGEMNINHKAFYHMLVGGSGTIRGDEICRLEGLRYYIDLKRQQNGNTILSVYLAPKKLLLALFGEGKEDVVNELLEYRKELVKQIRTSDSSDFSQIENEFKQKYEGSLPSDIDKNLIDFGVSTSRPLDSPYNSYFHQKKLKRSLRR